MSFDPVVPRKAMSDGSISMDENAFVWGGVPVTHPDRVANLSIPRFDYGMVSIPAGLIEARWPQAATLPLVKLAYEVGLRLDDLVAATAQPQQNLVFWTVGHGWTERLNFGSNKGGLNPPGTGLGTRRVADRQTFVNLRETLLQTSQNPALGNNGGCFVDAVPQFYDTEEGPVAVGTNSSGDIVCRSLANASRLDIATAEWFVECVRDNPDNVQNCGF